MKMYEGNLPEGFIAGFCKGADISMDILRAGTGGAIVAFVVSVGLFLYDEKQNGTED